MRCSIDGNNARIFAKAIQSLSKFATDLFVEADKESLLLRSFNGTQSAVGSVRFKRNFFESFQIATAGENCCKVSMKACLMVFRNMKQVERCELGIIEGQSKFQIKFKCRLETIKSAVISILNGESMTATVSARDMSNSISGSHRIFTEISSNFNTVEEEITMETEQNFLAVKNYVEGSRVNDKYMRSQLKFACSEFETYKIDLESSVTFCLKEFRAFLTFAEALNENLTLQFCDAGSPILVKIEKYGQIQCILIMSTLLPDDVSFHESIRQSDLLDNSVAPRKRKSNDPVEATTNALKTRKCLANETTLTNDTIFQFSHPTGENSSNPKSVDLPRTVVSRDDNREDMQDEIMIAEHPEATRSPGHQHCESDLILTFRDTEELENGDDDSHLGGFGQHMPKQPDANLRSVFSRCFELTYIPKEPSPSSQMYVPDSDMED